MGSPSFTKCSPDERQGITSRLRCIETQQSKLRRTSSDPRDVDRCDIHLAVSTWPLDCWSRNRHRLAIRSSRYLALSNGPPAFRASSTDPICRYHLKHGMKSRRHDSDDESSGQRRGIVPHLAQGKSDCRNEQPPGERASLFHDSSGKEPLGGKPL